MIQRGSQDYMRGLRERGEMNEQLRIQLVKLARRKGFDNAFEDARNMMLELGFPRVAKHHNLDQINFPTAYALFYALGGTLVPPAAPKK